MTSLYTFYAVCFTHDWFLCVSAAAVTLVVFVFAAASQDLLGRLYNHE
jgi:hypothetical protein